MNCTTNKSVIATSVNNCDVQKIASSELNLYLERQVQEIAPEPPTPPRTSSGAPSFPRSQEGTNGAWKPICIRTPQRKARYHDPNRWRLQTLKAAVFLNAKCSNTQQIRALLKVLGVSLDLRYTSSWLAIKLELMPLIERVVEQQNKVAISSEWNVPPSDPSLVPATCRRELEGNPIFALLAAMRDAIATSNWHPVQAALATHAEYKQQAWKQLNTAEKQQLKALVPEPLRLLSAAKQSGAIARFHEDPEGDIYWVWRTSDAQPELVTSCFAKIFVRNLAVSNLSGAA